MPLDPTDYHEFDQYQEDEPWDYNEDFQIVDGHLAMREPLSERPDTAPDGAIFIVDDPNDDLHGAVYRYYGDINSWVLSARQFSDIVSDEGRIKEPYGEWDFANATKKYGDNWTVSFDDTGDIVNIDYGGTNHIRYTPDGPEVTQAPTEDQHIARKVDITSESWDPDDWDLIDVSEHGFPGDETGGDLWAFITNNGPGEYHLPPGRYSIESELDFYQDLTWSMIKIVGHGDVTLVVNDNDNVDTLIRTADSSSPLDYVHLENFDVEIDYGTQSGRDDPTTFEGADAGLWRISVNKRFVAKDIELVGRRPFHSLRDWYEQDTANRTDYSGEIYNSRLNMLEKDSTALLEKVRMPDGGEGDVRPRVIPFSVESHNEGIQIYKHCHGAGWQGNTYYVKDGTGTSILFGCTAANGGAQMFRYGQADMSIGGQSWTDADLDGMDHTAGTHLDIHLGEGTAVYGHRVYDTRGNSELIRARSGNKQATIRDVYVYTTGTNSCIRTSSTSSGDNEVSEHGDGHLVFDNVRIEVESDDTSATKLGAIENRRINTVYRNVSTWIDVPNTSYASLNFQRGDGSFQDCKFGMSDTNNAGYVAIVGPNDSTEDRVGRIQFDKCVFEGEVFHYSGDQIPFLTYIGCDFTALGGSSPWGRSDPHNMFDDGDIDDFLFIGNAPFTSDSSYGYLTQNRITAFDLTVENNLDMTGGILDNLGNIRAPSNENMVFNLVGTGTTNRFTVYNNNTSEQVFNAHQNGLVEAPIGQLTNRGDNVTRTDADRKIYISDTEPTNWEDGDLWGEPQ